MKQTELKQTNKKRDGSPDNLRADAETAFGHAGEACAMVGSTHFLLLQL